MGKNIALVLLWSHILRMSKAPAKLKVSIDRDLKEAAEEVFAKIGLDASTAVRLFFTKVTQTRSIPFHLNADNAEPEFSP